MNKVLTGLLAGMIIGIILAPDKGSETLRRIKRRVNDYRDQVSDEADDLSESGSEYLNRGRSSINEVID